LHRSVSCNPDKYAKYFEYSKAYIPDFSTLDEELLSSYMSCTRYTDGSRYREEMTGEAFRNELTINSPSRMTCIFAFDGLLDCKSAITTFRGDNWDPNSLYHFKLIDDDYTNVARVNMYIVSYILTKFNIVGLKHETRHTLWKEYWGGKGSTEVDTESGGAPDKVGEIWEYLIEGRLECMGKVDPSELSKVH
jgi:hypothetical protein